MAKGTASTGKHQALRRRAEILAARVQQACGLQASAEFHREEKLKHAAIERKLKAELAGLNRLGFEGV